MSDRDDSYSGDDAFGGPAVPGQGAPPSRDDFISDDTAAAGGGADPLLLSPDLRVEPPEPDQSQAPAGQALDPMPQDWDSLPLMPEATGVLEEAELRELITRIVRQEVDAALREVNLRNIRLLIRREIHQLLNEGDAER